MLCHAVLCPGWAAADAVLMRTFPILSGAWTPQFNMGHVVSAVQANMFIVSRSLGALCSNGAHRHRTVSLTVLACSAN